MKQILAVFGTRPEAIKMAPLLHVLRDSTAIDLTVCVTAQHREMLDQVLDVFSIAADHDLDLMRPGQNLTDVTCGVLEGMQRVMEELSPDLVLVHGDTTTSFAAALAAFYARIPVGHVEAGLRTHDIMSPYPEELNRQMVSRIATWHFAPTRKNRSDLLAEGVDPQHIIVTGNTVIDALHWMRDQLQSNATIREKALLSLSDAGWQQRESGRPMILVTGHRRENFGEGFANICKALRKIAETHPETDIIYPVHLNPNVRKPVTEHLSDIENVHLIQPLDYPAFVHLMTQSKMILTDSGGIQEEAPSLGKPTVVMRDTTERTEAVDAGTVVLTGTDPKQIFTAVHRLLTEPDLYRSMAETPNPYGDGTASEQILHFLIETAFS